MKGIIVKIGIAILFSLSLAGLFFVSRVEAVNLVDPVCGTTLPPGSHVLTRDHRGSEAYCYRMLSSNTTLDCRGHTIRRWGTRGGEGILVSTSLPSHAMNQRVYNCGAIGWSVGLTASLTDNLIVANTYAHQATYAANNRGLQLTGTIRPLLSGIHAPGNSGIGMLFIDSLLPSLLDVTANSNARGLVFQGTHRAVISDSQFRRNSTADVVLKYGSSDNHFYRGAIDYLRLESGATRNRAHCVSIGRATSDGTAIDNTATCP